MDRLLVALCLASCASPTGAPTSPATSPPASSPAPAAVPRGSEPTRDEFLAAPNLLTGDFRATHGCSAKHVDGYFQVTCRLAIDGPGLLDVSEPTVGSYDVFSWILTWTVKGIPANTWMFDDGVFTLRASATNATWVPAGTLASDDEKLLRASRDCCIAQHMVKECIAKGIPDAGRRCKTRANSCPAFDACMQQALRER